MSLEHEASDKMGRALMGILIFAVLGCIAIVVAANMVGRSLSLLAPAADQGAVVKDNDKEPFTTPIGK